MTDTEKLLNLIVIVRDHYMTIDPDSLYQTTFPSFINSSSINGEDARIFKDFYTAEKDKKVFRIPTIDDSRAYHTRLKWMNDSIIRLMKELDTL